MTMGPRKESFLRSVSDTKGGKDTKERAATATKSGTRWPNEIGFTPKPIS